jgi:phosphoribosyl-AMP cyclohydrolase
LSQIPDFSQGNGLLPAIAQDAASGAVLMLGYMNQAAWEQTLATGNAVYYSRSRQKLWKKGEESGHVQRVKAIYVDCDADTILLQVEQVGGAACHEGYPTCFFRRWDGNGYSIEVERVFDPQQVYEKPGH